MSFHNDEEDDAEKDTSMLLNLGQKSGIYVADQTPTPTRLIKNCEEVGLFEDLQNVNPFDETFRRACEQNVQQTPRNHEQFHNDENSLHTPQVFPQFDAAVEGGIVAAEDLSKQTLDTPVVLDLDSVENILNVPPPACAKAKNAELSGTKYRAIAERPTVNNVQIAQTANTLLPSCIQFVQPQFITVTFPNTTSELINNTHDQQQQQQQHHIIATRKCSAKSNPLLLPKLSTNIAQAKETATANTFACSSPTTSTHLAPQPEPSSASLTPTSQLPIKERLKAILNQSNRSRSADWCDKGNNSQTCKKYKNSNTNTNKCSKDDAIERKRAASTRYRHKIRNEYKELRKRNCELHTENSKLKERIKLLEIENSKLKKASLQPVLTSKDFAAQELPAQIQIPASTLHLVMNIPKLVIPCGSSDLSNSAKLKSPLTYRIDKP